MSQHCKPLPRRSIVVLLALLVGQGESQAQHKQHDGYRVLVRCSFDASPGVRAFLQRELPAALPPQMSAVTRSFWTTSVDVAEAGYADWLEHDCGIYTLAQIAAEPNTDKTLLLHVRQRASGMTLLARDLDVRTRYLGPLKERHVRQSAHLVRAIQEVLLAAFSPIGEFRQIPDDSQHVLVKERTAARPNDPQDGDEAPGGVRLALAPGDLLVPVLVRDAPDGGAEDANSAVVPWTLLVVEDRQDGENWRCRVESASRRPFGVRRRGRVAQMAVCVRAAAEPVALHLHSRSDPPVPLPGCELLLRTREKLPPKLLGTSNLQGNVSLAPSNHPWEMVWFKSGTQVLGKVPIVFGLHRSMSIPLAEDASRLRAEADLAALRTELIDLVARRNILVARTRAALASKNLELARTLSAQLDRLPTRAQFNRRIDEVAQTATSSDRLSQIRIDKLVEQTRTVLGEFLDPREIAEVQDQVIAAGR